MLDSDSDEPGQTEAPPVEFEQDGDEADQSSIVASTRIDFKSRVLHISVPPIPRKPTGALIQSAPKLCADQIAFAAVTADGNIYLVKTSLTPTSKPLLARGDYSATVVHTFPVAAYGGVHLHRVALTLASHHAHVYDEDALHGASWDWILVHYSSGPASTLTAIRLPVNAWDKDAKTREEWEERSFYLPNQLSSIAFNPSRNPKRHTQLLTTDVEGVVRICEIATSGYPEEVRPELPRSIAWLATLYVPFMDSSSPLARLSAVPRRKLLLAAEWAMDGRCIVVLLGDGSWGLWDLEGVGPDIPNTLAARPAHTSPITGGGVTFFTLFGSLLSQQPGRQVSESKSGPSHPTSSASNLAPMTPNTRKTKQTNLFSEASAPPRLSFGRSSEPVTVPLGGISSTPTITANGTLAYDSLLFWYRGSVCVIPNVMLYWARALNASAPESRSSVQGPDAIQLQVSAGGEAITSVIHMPPSYPISSVAQQQRIHHNILIAAEHRYILYSPPKPSHSARVSLPQRGVERKDGGRALADLQLLSRGELDIGGLDRMLDQMGDASHEGAAPRMNIFGEPEKTRRVGFKSSR